VVIREVVNVYHVEVEVMRGEGAVVQVHQVEVFGLHVHRVVAVCPRVFREVDPDVVVNPMHHHHAALDYPLFAPEDDLEAGFDLEAHYQEVDGVQEAHYQVVDGVQEVHDQAVADVLEEPYHEEAHVSLDQVVGLHHVVLVVEDRVQSTHPVAWMVEHHVVVP